MRRQPSSDGNGFRAVCRASNTVGESVCVQSGMSSEVWHRTTGGRPGPARGAGSGGRRRGAGWSDIRPGPAHCAVRGGPSSLVDCLLVGVGAEIGRADGWPRMAQTKPRAPPRRSTFDHTTIGASLPAAYRNLGKLAAATAWPWRLSCSSGTWNWMRSASTGNSARKTSFAPAMMTSPPAPLVTRPRMSRWSKS